MTKKYQTRLGVSLIIVLFSILLCLPQIITQKAILGSDVLFHYNRFYETAMQIKTGQWHYFISLFSFEQSGRIINALYGPIFAYFQGLLVLISKNWLTYQILSRILIGSIAGHSLYLLLRKIGIRLQYALPISLFYLTTFSIQYWTIRQGFSSWGAAFYPLCLIPAFDFIQTGKIKRRQLGMSVALMFQVHVLTSTFLVLSYLPFYFYGFVKSNEKLKILKDGIMAIAMFTLLTINIWLPLLQLSSQNELKQPFVNQRLAEYTISQLSSKLLFDPLPLIALLGITLLAGAVYFRKSSPELKMTYLNLLIFLFLASGLFPWESLVTAKITIVEIIQFPFRFFIPATIFLLICLAMLVEKSQLSKSFYSVILMIALLMGVGQVIYTTQENFAKQFDTNQPVQRRKHMTYEGDADAIRQAIFDPDKNKFLNLVHKSTPDYLPIYRKSSSNKYDLYEELVILPRKNFKTSVQNSQLILEWTSDTDKKINLPIILYHHSTLTVNGQVITSKDRQLTTIGTPYINQKKGKNIAILAYTTPMSFMIGLGITLLTWLGCIISFFKRKLNKNKPI